MYAVIEKDIFMRASVQVWTDAGQIASRLMAANLDAGDVIPGAGGCRKVWWTCHGMGKHGRCVGGLFQPAGAQRGALLMVYGKAKFDNRPCLFETTARGH
ncbi:MAG TPA: hypothetical protein VMV78_09535 [Thiobacillus sp.]|jgi:hypothetical protein|nr:hypothetical protein [Thiobacillus sp.]